MIDVEVVAGHNRLPRLSGALLRRVREIVADAALDCTNRAKELAPKRTGTLARSIHAEQSDQGLTWEVGTDVAYARRVEYGFNGADRLGRVYHQAAQPYLTPAAEAVRPRFLGEMRNAVEEAAR